jgi:hypothetical protein
MVAEPLVTSPMVGEDRVVEISATYAEGIRAGLIGAVTIAVWFFLLDAIAGRPLYTPNVLGTALLHGAGSLGAPATIPISLETVVTFTWIHVLVFLLIGVAGARLVALAEREPSFGFGIVLFFVVFEFGFFLTSMVLAEPVLHALDWPAVLVGNLFAAAAMVATFRRRHPRLTISP